MNEEVFIEKIAIDKKGILSVTPEIDSFCMIYRSATGVYWNKDEKYLYFHSPVKEEKEVLKAYTQIMEAVKSEYGKVLKVSLNTSYENISENIKKQIYETKI
jgi:hypothetical protein